MNPTCEPWICAHKIGRQHTQYLFITLIKNLNHVQNIICMINNVQKSPKHTILLPILHDWIYKHLVQISFTHIDCSNKITNKKSHLCVNLERDYRHSNKGQLLIIMCLYACHRVIFLVLQWIKMVLNIIYLVIFQKVFIFMN